ncbi:hypothetical protein FGG08_002235 [Glutinoglossum americanum]|uniref:DUF7626 domain-containing protein n=1 Tax=Glutinoglossum americanum TaxID=1670608 RepID=A0A9P8I5A5_9PEZI|nr:hypothetical protein FGG08_002235 [Glutinoglossum americanum]
MVPKRTSETPQKMIEIPTKRNASVPQSLYRPHKRARIPGGRAPIPKRVTAELDSDDEIIVSMKKAGKSCTEIAKRLRDEGRINYRDKTITSRYVRIIRAQETQMEKNAALEQIEWEEEDLEALTHAVEAVDYQIQAELDKLTRRKWQMVVSQLRDSRPGGIFSQAECQRRYSQLMKGGELNASGPEVQSHGIQASAPQGSAPQGSASEARVPGARASNPSAPRPSTPAQLDIPEADLDESNDGLSFIPDSHESSNDTLEGGDDSEYKDEESPSVESSDTGYNPKVRRGTTLGTGQSPAKNVAKLTTPKESPSWATPQKSQGNATGDFSSKDHDGSVASAANTEGIGEPGIPTSSAISSGNRVLEAAASIDLPIEPTLAVASGTTIANYETTERGNRVAAKMLVCGREIPEPAATGRRLIVQGLPVWVGIAELQFIFQDFRFCGHASCDEEDGWFVDVATANDATRAVATLNRQLIMNEIISVVVYRHRDMLGYSFGWWPLVHHADDSEASQSGANGVTGSD